MNVIMSHIKNNCVITNLQPIIQEALNFPLNLDFSILFLAINL